MNQTARKRVLKICYGYHSNSDKKRPFIRLCGDYLSQMDFKIGDKVEVTITKNRITITNLQWTTVNDLFSTDAILKISSEADLGTAEAQPNRNSLV